MAEVSIHDMALFALFEESRAAVFVVPVPVVPVEVLSEALSVLVPVVSAVLF